MFIRSYFIPIVLFIINVILLSILTLEVSGILPHKQGGLGFFVPFLSFLSFQFIRGEQRRRDYVSRGLSTLQAVNTLTFIIPFIIFFTFLIRFI